MPPSADPPSAEKPPKKKKSGKKRGGQPGHKGHSRFLYEPEECEQIFNHHPETCSCCKEALKGEDAFPYRHQLLVQSIRNALKSHLQEAANYEVGSKEKTPFAKTVRTCRQLVKVEPALWLFVEVEGVEPTNNAAERALRPAVIWRRTSFGSQTTAGSTFVSRILTVVTSLKLQRRNTLEFMRLAVAAQRHSTTPPSLLPQSEINHDQVINAA